MNASDALENADALALALAMLSEALNENDGIAVGEVVRTMRDKLTVVSEALDDLHQQVRESEAAQ